HVIVATGSARARLRGVEPSERVMDSTAALEVPEVPERLLVVGGGYIGLELGQVYAALGSAVTLVEMTDGLLPGADRDLVQWVARRVEKQFAAVRLNARLEALRETAGGVEATVGGASLTFDRVLFAVGRRPLTEGLGLETTRAKKDARGFLEVDARGATADRRIFAGGGAGELIAEAAVAVEAALLAEDLALTIHTHPTLSETLMEAAETLLRG